jgi:uncharacterized membrane protein (UPF0182 family)
MIQTYSRIFPGLFKPFSSMPADLQKHVRYPEDLFIIQAQMYRTYHMDAPEVFYNREDLRQFPRQPAGFSGVEEGDGARMAPYYHHASAGKIARRIFPYAAMAPAGGRT